MKCQRCSNGEAAYRVHTDAIDMKVCAACAAEARRLGIAVEVPAAGDLLQLDVGKQHEAALGRGAAVPPRVDALLKVALELCLDLRGVAEADRLGLVEDEQVKPCEEPRPRVRPVVWITGRTGDGPPTECTWTNTPAAASGSP